MKHKKLLIFLSLIIILTIAFFATSNYRASLAQNYVKNGDKLSQQQNYQEAVLEYRKARILRLRNAEIAFKIAKTYYLLEKYDLSLSYYNKTIKLSPQNKDYYLATANCYWNVDNSSEAIFTLRQGVDKISEPGAKKELNILLGQIYLTQDESEKARKAFEAAGSDFWQGIYSAYLEKYSEAANYFAKSDEENAEKMAKTMAKIQKTANKVSKKAIFAAMLNQIDAPRLALPILKNLTSQNPDYRDGWVFLGYTYLELQKNNAAEEALLAALNLDQIHPLTYELLVQVYKNKGDNKKSEGYSQKAIKLENPAGN